MAIASTHEVTREYLKFLEEENLAEHRERIDDILAQYKDVRGGLIPVLQQVQECT